MKSLYSSLFFILLILQTNKLPAQEANADLLVVECEIVKVDSVGNYYVIYAKEVTENDKSEKYKIVSEKDSTVCQNIVVGEFYKITLDPPMPQDLNRLPVTYTGGAVIVSYGWGKDLYFAFDIRGLCYNPEFATELLKKREEWKKQVSLKPKQEPLTSKQEPLTFKNKRARKKYYDKYYKENRERIEKEREEREKEERYYETNPLFESEYENRKSVMYHLAPTSE